MYEYRARCRKVRVLDPSVLVRLDLDQGFGHWDVRDLILTDVDLLPGNALKAKQYIDAWVGNLNTMLVVQTLPAAWTHYGIAGYSCFAWRDGEGTNPNLSINRLLVRDGLALDPGD